MTKKDYIALAKVIKANTITGKDTINRTGFLCDLLNVLKADNPLFSESKFIEFINKS